jgi:hypothetical protein
MAEHPDLSISPEKVCAIIAMARQFEAKIAAAVPDPGSNASDDGMRVVLEDRPDDAVRAELVSFIHDLNVDDEVDLVSLTWLGRGDGDLDNWDELRAEAARAHNNRTAEYLLGIPLLASYLEEALSQFDLSCEDFEGESL